MTEYVPVLTRNHNTIWKNNFSRHTVDLSHLINLEAVAL